MPVVWTEGCMFGSLGKWSGGGPWQLPFSIRTEITRAPHIQTRALSNISSFCLSSARNAPCTWLW
eukprot:scaffold84618_cov21-Tisochrysis_lutea.AAC.2